MGCHTSDLWNSVPSSQDKASLKFWGLWHLLLHNVNPHKPVFQLWGKFSEFLILFDGEEIGGGGGFLLLFAVSHNTLNTLWSNMKQMLKSVSWALSSSSKVLIVFRVVLENKRELLESSPGPTEFFTGSDSSCAKSIHFPFLILSILT